MQSRTPIIAALLAGLLAVLLLNLYIGSLQQSLAPDMTSVLVSTHALTPGAVLDAKDITEAQRPTQALPKLAIKWEERSLYLGQRLDLPVPEGDYLLASYFGGAAITAQRLSEKIDAKANQRAVTIPVSDETSLERSLRPADRVDLLLTYTKTEVGAAKTATAGTAATKIVTTPLLENIYVVSTGQYGVVSQQYNTITILVSPDEAKLLIWAMKLGELSVTLRNPKDVALTDRTFVAGDLNDLDTLGKTPMKPADIVSQRRAAVEK
jgi:pilus assembly protein CpaB